MGGATEVIDISTNYNFIGKYDDTKDYQLGDLCIKTDGGLYAYVYDGWETIAYTPSSYNENTQIKKISYPTNCKNCGAILHNHICEYCDTDNGKEVL